MTGFAKTTAVAIITITEIRFIYSHAHSNTIQTQ